MVDDRGGALTVGLGLHDGIVVAAGWEGWPRDRRRRLWRMVPESVLFMALESGAAVCSTAEPEVLASSSSPQDWTVLGGTVEARQGGTTVDLGNWQPGGPLNGTQRCQFALARSAQVSSMVTECTVTSRDGAPPSAPPGSWRPIIDWATASPASSVWPNTT